MDILSQILAKLGELMLEADTLLMEIRVLTFDQGREWAYQFVAMSGVGLLLGSVIGWMIINHILGGVR